MFTQLFWSTAADREWGHGSSSVSEVSDLGFLDVKCDGHYTKQAPRQISISIIRSYECITYGLGGGRGFLRDPPIYIIYPIFS